MPTFSLSHLQVEWRNGRPQKSEELVHSEASPIPLRFRFSPGSPITYNGNTIEEKKVVRFENNTRLLETARKIEIELNNGRTTGLPVLI